MSLGERICLAIFASGLVTSLAGFALLIELAP